MIDGSKNDEKLYYFLFISKYQTVLLFPFLEIDGEID